MRREFTDEEMVGVELLLLTGAVLSGVFIWGAFGASVRVSIGVAAGVLLTEIICFILSY